jgi:hypothetical protein
MGSNSLLRRREFDQFLNTLPFAINRTCLGVKLDSPSCRQASLDVFAQRVLKLNTRPSDFQVEEVLLKDYARLGNVEMKIEVALVQIGLDGIGKAIALTFAGECTKPSAGRDEPNW